VRTARGYLLLGAAFVLCPCHLPLLAALLAGTAVGAVLAANTAAALVVGTVAFAGALLLGLRALDRAQAPPCRSCRADVEPAPLVRSDVATGGRSAP
jgi:mercuric ion transport protein